MSFGPVLVILVTLHGQMDREFYCDFAGGELDPALSRFGPNADQAIASEPGGLRITLPSGRQDKAGVGIEPLFGISGDFEITLRYEMLSVDTPSTGMGAGIKVWGKIDTDEFQAMTLGHMVSPGGVSGYSAILAREDRRGRRHFQVKKLASDAKRGRLRLTRTGSELAFAVAEGEGETFQELQRVKISTGDVLALRTSANSSGDACGASIRLVDLRIRADDLPAKVGPGQGESWIWLGVSVLSGAVVGMGGILLWRQRHVA